MRGGAAGGVRKLTHKKKRKAETEYQELSTKKENTSDVTHCGGAYKPFYVMKERREAGPKGN